MEFYVTFKEKQNFSKKELKKLSKNFEIDTECEIIDFKNDGLSALIKYGNRQSRVKDAVEYFLEQNKIEISDFTFA